MYAWRLGEVLPASDITVLRGIEGARSKEMYRQLANEYGITWRGRRYDRQDPSKTDPVNMAINHSSIAVIAASKVAVAVTGTIPQLGFIHEDSGISFCLDIADLYRDTLTLPVAFASVKEASRRGLDLERTVRKNAGKAIRKQKIISSMIDRIKELFSANDSGSDT